MHLSLTPTGLSLTVNGERIECAHLVVEAMVGQAPQVTFTPLDPLTGDVDGVAQVTVPPTPEQVNDAARNALAGVDKTQFEQACQTRLTQGARDPYQVALDVLVEMTNG